MRLTGTITADARVQSVAPRQASSPNLTEISLTLDLSDPERPSFPAPYLTSNETLTFEHAIVATGSHPTRIPGFPESPLDWRADSADPILLVFDGLDELSAHEGTARIHEERGDAHDDGQHAG